MSAYDVVIVGAGPAGLSAALILGRCRRRVLVCDADRPRNAAARALHGYLTRDGTPPCELRRLGLEELVAYPSVELLRGEVDDARCGEGGFTVALCDGRRCRARKLVLATGVVDDLPDVEGMREFYGRGVFHCPYCDGWEQRDRPLAVYGRDGKGRGPARNLLCWSRDVVLCTDGTAVSAEDRDALRRWGVGVRTEKIARLEGDDEGLRRVVFAGGEVLPRRALFFNTGQYQHSKLPEMLGCARNPRGLVEVNPLEMSSVPGLYVIGDASWDVHLAIVAAAEGAKAAFAVNKALLEEDFR